MCHKLWLTEWLTDGLTDELQELLELLFATNNENFLVEVWISFQPEVVCTVLQEGMADQAEPLVVEVLGCGGHCHYWAHSFNTGDQSRDFKGDVGTKSLPGGKYGVISSEELSAKLYWIKILKNQLFISIINSISLESSVIKSWQFNKLILVISWERTDLIPQLVGGGRSCWVLAGDGGQTAWHIFLSYSPVYLYTLPLLPANTDYQLLLIP